MEHAAIPLKLPLRYYRVNKALQILGICFFLAACSPQIDSTQPALPSLELSSLPSSLWGEVQAITQAEDMNAPAILGLSRGLFFVWTGSQEGEARLFSRGVTASSQIMALKAFYPLEPQLFAADERVLLLWLDRNASTVDMRLQAALLNEIGIAERGIITLSDVPTRRYSAIEAGENSMAIVYSGGFGEVNNLYLRRIDTNGLGFIEANLRHDADFPALLADAGGESLFWLEGDGKNAYHARLGERELSTVRRIGRITLAEDEVVEDFRVAYDGSFAYLFWQIRKWDGSRYILYSAGFPDGEFSEAQRINATWAVPANESNENGLPVALNIGNQLGIAYFQAGTMGAFQPIVESGALIGRPNLRLLPNARLALAWSSPRPDGFANLLYTEED